MLVATSDGALVTTTGPQRIVTRMADNLLSAVHSQERGMTAQRRYRIGDYEFREAEHVQIQRWARLLGIDPEKVLEVLANSQKREPFPNSDIDADFQVVDGVIVSLVWDFDQLPIADWEWEPGLQIVRLGVKRVPAGTLPPLPECLHELVCYQNGLTSLALQQVPKLKKLDCKWNELTELDLSPVPGLMELDCHRNNLDKLDLLPVPGLLELSCWSNRITNLDLASIPGLQRLSCSINKLTELDLAGVPRLRKLDCEINQLTTLDLAPVPDLQVLFCGYNALSELDLMPVPRLLELGCEANELTKLALSSAPGLKKLWCDPSVQIEGALPNLKVHHPSPEDDF